MRGNLGFPIRNDCSWFIKMVVLGLWMPFPKGIEGTGAAGRASSLRLNPDFSPLEERSWQEPHL